MKITKKQLKKVILEAMFDFRTVKRNPNTNKPVIKPAMAAVDPGIAQQLHRLTRDDADEDGYGWEQAKDLADSMGAVPGPIAAQGGYEGAARLGDRQRLIDLTDNTINSFDIAKDENLWIEEDMTGYSLSDVILKQANAITGNIVKELYGYDGYASFDPLLSNMTPKQWNHSTWIMHNIVRPRLEEKYKTAGLDWF
jgi:hypothetical protein